MMPYPYVYAPEWSDHEKMVRALCAMQPERYVDQLSIDMAVQTWERTVVRKERRVIYSWFFVRVPNISWDAYSGKNGWETRKNPNGLPAYILVNSPAHLLSYVRRHKVVRPEIPYAVPYAY